MNNPTQTEVVAHISSVPADEKQPPQNLTATSIPHSNENVNPKIRLNLDRYSYTAKPSGSYEISILSKRLRHADSQVETTQENFMQAVLTGRSFTPALLSGGGAENWLQQEIFALDFDNENGRSTPQEVKGVLDKYGIPTIFGYHSFSSTTGHNKFRVLFRCSEVITDPQIATSITTALMSLFEGRGIDKTCKDLPRIFYGTHNPDWQIREFYSTERFDKDIVLKLLPPELQKGEEMQSHTKGATLHLDLAEEYRRFDMVTWLASQGYYGVGDVEVKYPKCPVCGHNDDFVVNRNENIFVCFSASGLAGGGGNIHTLLRHMFGLDEHGARVKFKELIGYTATFPSDITTQGVCERVIHGTLQDCKSVIYAPSASGFADFFPFDPESDTAEPKIGFPVDLLPRTVAKYLKQVSIFTQTPQEMSGLLVLGVLALCVQRRYKVRVRDEWEEALCLAVLIIANSGERKSAVFSKLLSPVYDYVKRFNEENALKISENAAQREILKEKIKNAKKTAIFEDNREELNGLLKEELEFQKLDKLRLTLDDTTVEALLYVASRGNDNLIICSPEGDSLDNITTSRYELTPNMGAYLKGVDGERIENLRKISGDNSVEDIRLSIAVMGQHSVLKALMGSEKAKDRGLCGRFCYVVLRKYANERLSNPDFIDDDCKAEYASLITRLLDFTSKYKGVEYLTMSDEADVLRTKLQDEVEVRLREGGDLAEFAGWSNKLVGGKCSRIAGIFHVIECVERGLNPADVAISGNVFARAVRLSEFLVRQALNAFEQGNISELEKNALYIWERLKSLDSLRVSMTELQQSVSKKKYNSETLSKPLNELVMRGYIRIERNKNRKGTNIFLNPEALEIT